jgi:hypothetical protein
VPDIYFRHAEQADPEGKVSLSQMKKAANAALLAITLAVVAAAYFLPAQTSPYGSDAGRDAKACKLMPTAELETSFGGKVTSPHGTDGDSSICTVNIGRVAVKLQSAPPGANGVPTSVPQGLVGARMMLGEAKHGAEGDTKDFGSVGCLRMKMTKGFDGKSLAKPLLTTSCFLVEGGYLNMSVASENSKQVGFELIKSLLDKAAAKR